jgi:ribose 5-phosphate isomerase A
VIMCDDSKLSAALGTKWHVPIEVLTFGHGAVVRFLRELGAKVSQRLTADGAPFITDNGNLVFDSHFGVMHNPHSVADALNQRAGVVEHGLFLDLTTDLIVAGAGGVQHRRRANG